VTDRNSAKAPVILGQAELTMNDRFAAGCMPLAIAASCQKRTIQNCGDNMASSPT